MSEVKREHWGSTWGFIMAAAGSAIGLGNIWRFPYLAAQYGGGIFLLTYILLSVTFGFTLMIAESRTEEKDVMVKVVVNLINQRNE